MHSSKIIFYLIFLSFLLLGCKKKDKTPKEYFSFDANGVHYDYPQEKKWGFLGESQTLWAGASSGSLGYFMGGSSWKNPTAPGAIVFNFAENQIPTEDTVILNGVSNQVRIEKFLNENNNYELKQPLKGKIAFTERSANLLSGTFEFDVFKMKVVNMQWETTDTILHITNGRFSIIPSP